MTKFCCAHPRQPPISCTQTLSNHPNTCPCFWLNRYHHDTASKKKATATIGKSPLSNEAEIDSAMQGRFCEGSLCEAPLADLRHTQPLMGANSPDGIGKCNAGQQKYVQQQEWGREEPVHCVTDIHHEV